ncbi:X-Pro dipeptidyl-peptidase (S15 family) [Mycobacteroides abscessus subsp. bolletii]|uniref:alpha/beta hydrolase n=1 Tax=Mycobacteroides abscessus TaxID=36809 RepID=UPI0009A7958C|nr:alpha/beta fold hydrolase [Mycobacteroides abscessus]SKG69892.1 X-Pro dipeptidyl-peptidase (S15 family) [Mycobacteroides abscessus subsp. bolletii]SLF40616.1 X-Pro dipeptidyl-peptidase (S15 family) [Mycobacteroides abscessus subsp. bolletii]
MTAAPIRSDVVFHRDGISISAWHYRPGSDALRTEQGAPAVILGHGYGLTRDCGLQSYAERFSAAGLHAVVIDYSGFGASGGQHREVVRASAQVADFVAAIEGVRRIEGVDPDRVALWGTSYSGGLVIAAAAQDGNIAAIIAQVPNLDNRATMAYLIRHTPPRRMGWLLSCIVRDVGRAVLRRDPFYIPANGHQGERAAYASDEAMAQLSRIVGPSWRNRVALRDFATVPMFRPVKKLSQLQCRVQLFACERDDLTPVEPTLRAARVLGGRAELHRYDTGHFGIYVDPVFSQALAAQEKFLVAELNR